MAKIPFTVAIGDAPAAIIAAAETIDLDSVDTNHITIAPVTGVTDVTSLGAGTLVTKFVSWPAGLTLHNSASLALIGAADRVTVAGAFGAYVADGNGNWQEILYQPLSVDPSSLVPVGAMAFFAASAPPSGWLECNGASLSRTTYAALFAAIGTTFGSVDGTHFTLPDLRGYFQRGWDNSRGIDTGRTFGSAQDDGIKQHTHPITASTGSVNMDIVGSSNPVGSPPSATNTGNNTVNATGVNETRPKNIALLPVIKY